VGIDRPYEDDRTRPPATEKRRSAAADVPDIPNDTGLRPKADHPALHHETRDRATYYAEHKAAVEAEYRAYAIDNGCTRVRETEETVVTPAILRIESQDPDRHLVGFEHRLKGKDRLSEKVTNWMDADPSLTADKAFNLLKDAIRYTFQYHDEAYADGVRADTERLKAAGFELAELRNTWMNEEYKGINSRWRVPGSGHLFEVQFHTQASFDAKQETHPAYERLRSSSTTETEQNELVEFQRRVTARVVVPTGAPEIPDYP
jgi:hypothetical protein